MKILILTLLCVFTLTKCLPDVRPLQAPTHQEPEALKKVRTTSYTTNIVHDNSAEDGQAAQSSISVNFGQSNSKEISRRIPHKQLSLPPKPTKPTANQNLQGQINPYPTPKTIADYAKKEIQSQFTQSANLHPSFDSGLLAPLLVQNNLDNHIYEGSQESKEFNVIHRIEGPKFPQNHQELVNNPQQNDGKTPQLFNVGYSINIMNQEPKLQFRVPNPTYRQTKLVRGDIITGSHKDAVGKPSELNLVPASPPNYHQTTQIHHQLNLIPANYISFDQKGSESPQVYNDVEPKNSYVWKTLSPGIEISGFVSDEEQQQKFDHAGALGRSEGFDITNVVDESHAEPVLIQKSQPVFSSYQGGIQNNKVEFDMKSFYDKFYKNVNTNLYKQEVSPPVHKPQSIDFGIFKSIQPQINDLTIFPNTQHLNPKIIAIPQLQPQTLDTKYLKYAPTNNLIQYPEVLLPNGPQPSHPQPQQYQIHENVNEGMIHPKDVIRQGRYMIPAQNFRNLGHPYRPRMFPKEVFSHHMFGLRPPPMMLRIPKYVQ